MKEQHPHGFFIFISDQQLSPARIHRVDFEDGLELLDALTLEIRNTNMVYTRGRNKLRGCDIRLEAGRHGVQWDTLFTGKIASVVAQGDRKSNHRITVKALPVDIIKDGWMVKRQMSHIGVSRFSDMVDELSRRFHPNFRRQIEQSQDIGDLISGGVRQWDETDIEFCNRMALAAGGWEFAIKGQTVIFRKPQPVGKAVFEFKFGVNIHSYQESESDAKTSSGTTVAVEAGSNSVKIDNVNVTVEDLRKTNEMRTEDVARGGGNAFGHERENLLYRPRIEGVQAVLEAKGNAKKAATEERTISITGPADIRCRAGKAVSVTGLGELSGKYYIKLVKFKWSKSDGGVMTATLTNKQKS